MGQVYLARDASLDRSVALTILPPDLVRNEERVRRFVQEAKAASSLSHPPIVAIHEIGEADVRLVSGWPLPYAVAENGKSRLVVRQIATGRDLDVLPAQTAEIGSLAFSPDGSYVFYRQAPTDAPPAIYQVAALGGVPRRILVAPQGIVFCSFSVSPGGARVATFERDANGDQNKPSSDAVTLTRTIDGAKNIWRIPIDGGPARQLTHFAPDQFGDYAYSADGSKLYFTRSDHAPSEVLLIKHFR